MLKFTTLYCTLQIVFINVIFYRPLKAGHKQILWSPAWVALWTFLFVNSHRSIGDKQIYWQRVTVVVTARHTRTIYFSRLFLCFEIFVKGCVCVFSLHSFWRQRHLKLPHFAKYNYSLFTVNLDWSRNKNGIFGIGKGMPERNINNK